LLENNHQVVDTMFDLINEVCKKTCEVGKQNNFFLVLGFFCEFLNKYRPPKHHSRMQASHPTNELLNYIVLQVLI
jgi:hypothetical protein